MAKAPHDHSHHAHQHGLLGKLLMGGTLIAAAVVAAPFLMYGADALGVIDVTDAGSKAYWANTWIMNMCGSGTATGLAEASGNLLSHVPVIGSQLAEGGIVNAVVSGAVGIGGRIIGNYVNKHDDGTSSIRWGNVIKTACLVTSLLVASPAIFTAISMGITAIGFGSGLVEASNLESIQTMTNGTKFFGTTGNIDASGAFGALGAIGPHLVTCAAPIIAATSNLVGYKKDKPEKELPKPSFAARKMARREIPLQEAYPALF